mmetsp:Transcript_28691/g.66817  ORF Transcript_28691/g.66817 Transcript_28691/m.66817 type:complete len:381 (-) Transcript_28691:136-1278(-)
MTHVIAGVDGPVAVDDRGTPRCRAAAVAVVLLVAHALLHVLWVASCPMEEKRGHLEEVPDGAARQSIELHRTDWAGLPLLRKAPNDDHHRLPRWVHCRPRNAREREHLLPEWLPILDGVRAEDARGAFLAVHQVRAGVSNLLVGRDGHAAIGERRVHGELDVVLGGTGAPHQRAVAHPYALDPSVHVVGEERAVLQERRLEVPQDDVARVLPEFRPVRRIGRDDLHVPDPVDFELLVEDGEHHSVMGFNVRGVALRCACEQLRAPAQLASVDVERKEVPSQEISVDRLAHQRGRLRELCWPRRAEVPEQLACGAELPDAVHVRDVDVLVAVEKTSQHHLPVRVVPRPLQRALQAGRSGKVCVTVSSNMSVAMRPPVPLPC